MMPALVSLLLVVAGAALIAQNLIMASASTRVSTLLIPLLLNSAVGLLLLSLLLLWQGGTSGLRELIATIRPVTLVPGVLGTFFVFASLTGYRTLGAAPTIALLVASQLVVGLVVDLYRTDPPRIALAPMFGVALLILGACLILFRKA